MFLYAKAFLRATLILRNGGLKDRYLLFVMGEMSPDERVSHSYLGRAVSGRIACSMKLALPLVRIAEANPFLSDDEALGLLTKYFDVYGGRGRTKPLDGADLSVTIIEDEEDRDVG